MVPRHRAAVGSYGGGGNYERGTPVAPPAYTSSNGLKHPIQAPVLPGAAFIDHPAGMSTSFSHQAAGSALTGGFQPVEIQGVSVRSVVVSRSSGQNLALTVL